MTKPYNSCKTCNIAKSNIYCHLHVIFWSLYMGMNKIHQWV